MGTRVCNGSIYSTPESVRAATKGRFNAVKEGFFLDTFCLSGIAVDYRQGGEA